MIAGNSRPSGGAVAAVSDQMLGASAQTLQQIKVSNRATRASALLTVESDHDGRTVVELSDPRSNDPDHAGVPPLCAADTQHQPTLRRG